MNAVPPVDPAAARESAFLYRDAIREHGELLESLAISLREATFRGDDFLTIYYVKQARLVVINALEAAKALQRLAPK